MSEVRLTTSRQNADYYAVGATRPVSVRVSNLYPVPPLCMTCIKSDCEHAEAVTDYIEQQRSAA